MSGWSNITFSQEVYRWLLSIDVLENKGEINDKQIVSIPFEDGLQFQNGYYISQIIKVVLMKNGESASDTLNNVQQQNSKNTKANNWNFIWLSFSDLRIQFDNRIKELILNGENALISEVVKQLFERDDNKNTSAMKGYKIKQKPSEAKKEKKTGKASSEEKANQKGSVDIKKITTSKNPDEAESSLQFLILLLTQSLQMQVEEVLGLFTNQNKYLAHLIVKGISDRYEGVILFYTLLNKHHKKLKSFIESDPKDAHSCLYAIKPGFISKNQEVAELCITVFLKIGHIYEWFISDVGKGSATLFLGIKRHPQCQQLYFDLLMQIIQNEEADFFAHQYKQCFRDSYEMTEISTFIISSLSRSFFKHRLIDMGILAEWIEIALSLFEQSSLDCKVMAYKFMGEVMNYIPEAVESNEEYLTVFSSRWKERKVVEFIHLIDEMVLIFEKLAGEKNPLAKKLYQIFIQIFDDVYQQPDKKQYLLTQFIEILPDFPSVPVNYLVEIYRESKLSNLETLLIDRAADLSHDPNCLVKVAEDAVKFFASDSVTHQSIAVSLYRICRKTLESPEGRNLILKVIKACLYSYSNLQITKKNPALVKSQPMYLINKGNSEKVTQQQETTFSIKEGIQRNLISLIDKLSELVTESINEELQTSMKNEILETNSFIKKRHFKVGSRALSNLLQKRFGVNKQEELEHDEDYNNRKSLEILENNNTYSNNKRSSHVMSASRYGGPPTLRKEFAEIIEKKRREEEERKFEEEKKMLDSVYKKNQVKKELEKANLLRGFAQQAEIKEDGFWQKFHKDEGKELELYPPELMEAKDVEMIDNLFKKYHRLLRSLFLKYTFSGYSAKTSSNFEDNKERKETISTVELIKFMKDYKMYFLTSNSEVQSLVRDINVKLLKKRQTQDLDFGGFEQFIIQFCAVIFTKTHTITAKSSKGQENIKKRLIHLSHSEIVAEWFKYIRTVFIERGEKTSIFDEPEAAYFNQTEVIKEFNKKLQEDPGFILPEGYKKITDKVMVPEAAFSPNISSVNLSYLDVLQVLDEVIFESELGMHIIEPIIRKETKVRVKPHAFVNVKAKLLDSTETKPRAFSSVIEKKTAIPPIKMLQKKTLTFGMKMGLSYISYKDKLLGEQVAYVIDDMLDAVEKGRNTIEKEKIINEATRNKNERQARQKKQEEERRKKMKERKTELSKIKENIEKKKQKDLEDTKDEREKKEKLKAQRKKRIEDDKKKYLDQQQKKLKEKKEKDEAEKQKSKEDKKKKRQEKKKNKEQFEKFNAKKVQQFSTKSSSEVQKKKQLAEKEKEQQKKKEEMYVKLRQKIHEKDKRAIEMKQKTNEQILELFNSAPIRDVFKEFELSMKALFDFLMKNTYVSITQKKLKNEIILETWHYFNLVFQLSPLIISSKDLFSIFRTLTKEKQISTDYHTGLSYEQFKQALLRIAIKHKSVFNKISQKIKEDDMTDKQINDVINKDIEEKQKNEFDEPKEIDVKSLLKEEDVKKEFFNHYGDVSKVNDKTLKGLIYYLRVPRDKQGQEERWREIVASKIKYNEKQTQQLKEKLNQEYSLKKQEREREKERIRKRLAASQSMNQSMLNNSNLKASSIIEEKAEYNEGEENKAPK